MEGHDVFTQRQEIGEEDPFAGSDFGDWEQEPEQPTEVAPSRAEELVPQIEDPNIESGYDGPVAKEGEVSPNHPAHPQWHEDVREAPPPENGVPATQQAIGGQPTGEAPVAASPAAQEPELPPEAPPAPPPPPSPSQAAAEREDAPVPPVASPAPAPVPQPPAPQAATPSAPLESSPAAGAPPAPTQEPEAENAEAGEMPTQEDIEEENVRREEEGDVPIEPPTPDGDAPEPEEVKDKRNRVTHRKYVILRAQAEGQFEQLNWYEDSKRKLTTKGANGAKRQTVVLARGTEEALKFGYVVCGSPHDGVNLVAVAAAYFQVKPVKPAPPEPMKQRLQIG